MLKLHVLASGSTGNCSIVENLDNGRAVMVDCGITKRDFFSRCNDVSFDPVCIDAILVTHEHTDHTKGLGVVCRGLAKMGCAVSLSTSVRICAASREIDDALKGDNVSFKSLSADNSFVSSGMKVLPFATSHDAAESFGFRFEDSSGDAISFVTDTGFLSLEAKRAMEYARIVAVESNHDVDMLKGGPYPYYLKQRILSKTGHLSNRQASDAIDGLVQTLASANLGSVVGMHVSKENNIYDLAMKELCAPLERVAHPANAYVARRDAAISV